MLFLVVLLYAEVVFGISLKINLNGTDKIHYDITEADMLFEQFMLKHDKQYDTEEEKLMRSKIFREKLMEINKLNMEHPFTIYGITEFSDLTNEEFKERYSSCAFVNRANPLSPMKMNLSSVEVRSSLDWRDKNAVTAVKNQGGCGSCWAHSIIGCLESQYAIKNGQLLDLSEQQLVDCDTSNKGCEGGDIRTAGNYLVQSGAMAESDYPYMDNQGTCSFDAGKVEAKASQVQDLTGMSEQDLKAALTKYGPIAIGMSSDEMLSYKGGILTKCTSNYCGHALLLVGYNEDGPTPYWIIKNSWGTTFGENGYLKLVMGKQCNGFSLCEMAALQM